MSEYTTEEIREKFISEVRALVGYWSYYVDELLTTRERLSGLAHSIMVLLDGCAEPPSFIVAPFSDPGDRDEYSIENGEKYYPDNYDVFDQIKGDISGCLHEELYNGWK